MKNKEKDDLLSNPLLYYPQLAGVYGIVGALLIQQVRYWCEINKAKNKNLREDTYWCFLTHKQWSDALQGVSDRSVRRVFDELEKTGVIITARFNKKAYDKTKWYRVDEAILINHLREKPTGQICKPTVQICKTQRPNMYVHVAKLAAPIQETIKETTEETSLATQKTTGIKKVRTIGTAKSILEQYKSKPVEELTANTLRSMTTIWRELLLKHTESVKFVPSFTLAQKGQLQKIRRIWVGETDTTLKYLLTNWVAFTKFVVAQNGLKTAPDAPHVGFMLKYAGEARSFVLNAVQLTAPKKAKPVMKKPAPVSTTGMDVPEVVEASLEDIMKWKKVKT